MVSRRKVVRYIIPALTLFSAGATAVGYWRSGCPLSSSGICQGPCSAFLDANGDHICDRLSAASKQEAVTPQPSTQPAKPTESDPAIQTAAPLLPPTVTAAAAAASESATPLPTATPVLAGTTACRFGLVNDPYPGHCRSYVDKNGNGICDLSEPKS
jgi:hypothetical protein